MNKKPHGERKDFDEELIPIVMNSYIERLSRKDVIPTEVYMNFRTQKRKYIDEENVTFEMVQKQFREIINKIDNEKR